MICYFLSICQKLLVAHERSQQLRLAHFSKLLSINLMSLKNKIQMLQF